MSIKERLSGIYTNEETARVHITESSNGISVVVDVHAPASGVLVLHPCGHVEADRVLRRHVQDGENAVPRA